MLLLSKIIVCCLFFDTPFCCVQLLVFCNSVWGQCVRRRRFFFLIRCVFCAFLLGDKMRFLHNNKLCSWKIWFLKKRCLHPWSGDVVFVCWDPLPSPPSNSEWNEPKKQKAHRRYLQKLRYLEKHILTHFSSFGGWHRAGPVQISGKASELNLFDPRKRLSFLFDLLPNFPPSHPSQFRLLAEYLPRGRRRIFLT